MSSDGFKRTALYAATQNRLYAWGHYWAEGQPRSGMSAISSFAVRDLMRDGLVESQGVFEGKEWFTATDKGRALLAEWMDRPFDTRREDGKAHWLCFKEVLDGLGPLPLQAARHPDPKPAETMPGVER